MNQSNHEITLQPQWFAHLPSLLGINGSPLLPAFDIDQISATVAIREMQQAGILEAGGKVKAALAKPLQTIAQAKACCRLKMLCEGDLIEYQVFWIDKNSEPAALKRGEDGFVLSATADSHSLLELVAEYTGIGTFAVIPPLGAMSKAEAVVFAGCHDLIRKTMFLSMGGSATESAFTIEQLQQHISQLNLGSSSLCWAIQALLPEPVTPDQNQIQQALRLFENKGYITASGAGYVAEEGLLFLCRRMLLFNSLIKVDAMRVAGSSIEAASFTSIQCGLRDNVLIEVTDDKVSFNGLSGQQLMLTLQKFLTDPETVKIGKTQTSEELCECGKPFAADAKFCKFCGKPRPAGETEETPRFCSKCGAALKPGKTFCTKCGNKAV
ncbi:MAG: zinc ribbon domain-containing protein [Candidatus Riflebacteria bacterium]|nr:zinc ribbon domain-containing protein [Candidatus Riflebacteria bacterium]